MKYVIFGANRVAKDFMYVFDELEILWIAEQGEHRDCYSGVPVYDVEKLFSARDDYGKVIVCDFDKTQKIEYLEQNGFKYGTDYVMEEDFFDSLDDVSIPKNHDVMIWGTGSMASRHSGVLMEQFNVRCFIDSNKRQDTFMGKPVFEPGEITDWGECFVVVATVKDNEICAFLKGKGLQKNVDYMSFQKLIGLPSRMLRQTIFDRSYYELECHTMENHLEILKNGNTRCCCTTFVQQDLDNIFDKSVDELWHSKLHKIMCLSTENHTYSFCDKTMCPLFVACRKDNDNGEDRDYGVMSRYPKVLAVGYDSTCNLSCVTCRKELHAAQGEELDIVNSITDKLQEEYLPNCDFLIMAGDGEVFSSPAYRSVYRSEECNPQYIRLLSNGMLFNRRKWEEFAQNKTGKIMLTVSVDAATKKTYESIRRNGNFDVLSENMRFAAELRKEGRLSYFRMNFVVQRGNYKEMPLFVRWGEELGVDEVFFTKILNWGTYSMEEFGEISMMESDGITPKDELKEVLDMPIMKSRIVDLGTIQYSHKADRVEVVENYYMWELEKRGGKLFG